MPQKPANGEISTPDGTLFNAVIVYTCDEGFEFCPGCTQPITRECQLDATWSDSDPSCSGNAL